MIATAPDAITGYAGRMTTQPNDALVRFTQDVPERPMPATLRAARDDVLAAVATLRTIADASLAKPWTWKGGSEEEIRYGFYRIGEAFERAGIDAGARLRATGADRGRAADLVAPATEARWNLQGLLISLDDALWTADPGGGEWTISQTLGHTISGQRYYGVGLAWWQSQGFRADDPNLPPVLESIYDGLPTEEVEAEAPPASIRTELDVVLDRATERLAGLPEDRLALGARWSGFAVDVGFRLGRWSSHIREHTVQVEKTLAMLDQHPTEVDRLVRLILVSWGGAEAVVYGSDDAGDAIAILADAAAAARITAAEIAGLASS
jgi:hypothetical protein